MKITEGSRYIPVLM